MNDGTETIHLKREYSHRIECGVTGPVRITHRFREVTCQPCIDAEYERRCGNHSDDETCRVCDITDEVTNSAAPKPLAPGDTVYRQWGALNIRIDMHHDGVTITADHHPSLNRAFTNLDQGRAYLRFLYDEATAGKPVWLIEAGAGVLTSTMALGQDEADLVADINATLDGATAIRTQVTAQLRAEVDNILADADPNWARKLRAEVVQAAKKRNEPRDYSKTRVHRQEPTPAELDRIRQHRNGIVTTAPGQPWTLLKAIEARGYGTGVRENPLRPKLAYVRLNGRGLAVATEQMENAA